MEIPSTTNDCKDLQLHSDPFHHVIVPPPLGSYQDIHSTLKTENLISECVDAVTERSDNKITSTVKTDVYHCNKVIQHYVAHHRSVKHNPRDECTMRNIIVKKCIIKNEVTRLSTIKSDVIINGTVHSHTVVEKSVKSSTIKNDHRVLSTERLPLRDVGLVVPPLMHHQQVEQQ